MFPKKGNVFPDRNRRGKSGTEYASAIATALRGELGDTHRAVKTVMRWTGASERTVKHWLGGEKGPSGGYLLLLIQKSDAVLHALLVAAGRGDSLSVDGASPLAGGTDGATEGIKTKGARRRQGSASTLGHDGYRPSDHGDDPINGPINGPLNPPRHVALNQRQRWFLRELAGGGEVRMDTLQQYWVVSERTAKRDIAALKALGLIEFRGARKTGDYRLKK